MISFDEWAMMSQSNAIESIIEQYLVKFDRDPTEEEIQNELVCMAEERYEKMCGY